MGDINKFLGKPVKKIIEGEEIDVYPLQFNDVDILMKFADPNADIRAKATRDMLLRGAKKTFPEATEDQILSFNAKFMNEFLGAIFEVSGLKIDQKKLDAMTEAF